ncbi:MAG TPA: hypothetical protein VG815_14030, partial [Chloroflexota bacterium]|nr:hypothetical protein [Chloroflexota bacterium]
MLAAFACGSSKPTSTNQLPTAGCPPDCGAGGGGSGSAGTPATTAGGSGITGGRGSVGGMTSTAQTLPPITDYTQPGPFKTTVEAKVGPGNNYTIYRPDPLGANGFLHSPIIFGPGIATSCDPLGSLNIYTTLLTHFASHGFVTICVNSLSGSPGAPANLDAMKMGL